MRFPTPSSANATRCFWLTPKGDVCSVALGVERAAVGSQVPYSLCQRVASSGKGALRSALGLCQWVMGEERNGDERPGRLDPEKTVPMERKPRRQSDELTRPISMGSRDATALVEYEDRPDVASAEPLDTASVRSPLRRNAPLLLGVAAVLALSPVLTRFLDSYRAVVLEVEGSEMLILKGGSPPPPPIWVSALAVEAGDVLVKERGSWSAELGQSQPSDREILELYRRWVSSYEGVIEKIDEAPSLESPSVARVRTDEGESLQVELWSENLGAAQVGRRLRKEPSSWEPVLVDKAD